MAAPQVFSKVILTELFNRKITKECETEDDYHKAVKKMKCPTEIIGNEGQWIKPVFDIDADTDIDIDAEIEFIKSYIEGYTDEPCEIKYMKREPRMYKGNMKYSYRVYVQKTKIKVVNMPYFIDELELVNEEYYDKSIYNKNMTLHTPYTNKKSGKDENGNSIIVEAPPLIPVGCSVFDCCASYICEDYCTILDKVFDPDRLENELLDKLKSDRLKKEKENQKNKDVNSDAIVEKLSNIVDKLSIKRSEKYDTWSKVIWCIIGICEKNDIGMTACSTIVHSFSQKATNKYREKEVDKWFNQSYYNQGDKQLGWPKLMEWLKMDDPEYYNEIRPTKGEKEDEDEDEHQKWKKEWEKTHCKIVNSTIFLKLVKDDKGFIKEFKTFDRKKLLDSYEDAIFWKEVEISKGKTMMKKFNHVKEWLTDPTMRKYEDADVFPPPLKCPSNILNLWTPFYVEQLPDLTQNDKSMENLDKLNEVLHHIKILCNHDDDDYMFVLKWIGQMLKHPAIKSFTPCLISEEGAGKGTLMYLLKRMLGSSKVIETADPANVVWGSFNDQMATGFLVNLNEMDIKSASSHEGKIKALQTDESLYINPKGKSNFKIKSYHRFLITTNKNNPITTHEKDRRNKIIRSSDEKLHNGDYFKRLLQLINDDIIVKLVYEHCIKLPNLETFHTEPLKQNAYQQSLSEGNIPIPERFMKHFAYKNRYYKEPKEFSSTTILKEFTKFITQNGMKYDTDSAKLMRNLQLLKLPLWYEKKKANHGNLTIIDFNVLSKHYNIFIDDNKENETDTEEE
jgi:predicted nucleic acid-binding protein